MLKKIVQKNLEIIKRKLFKKIQCKTPTLLNVIIVVIELN